MSMLRLLLTLLVMDVVAAVRPYNKAIDDGTYGFYPVRSYVTEDTITSPHVNWLQWSPDCDDGRLHFLTPRGGSVNRPGPMILDGNGDLIWSRFFDNDFGGQAYNLQVQQYQGEDYLTFWLGDDAVRGHGAGMYYMLNSSYHIVHTVEALHGQAVDLHEFVITPQGTALITVYEVVRQDMTALRAGDWGERSPQRGDEDHDDDDDDDADDDDDDEDDDEDRNFIWDCLIQEVDIDTGMLLFEWRATDHIDVTDTYHNVEDRGSKDWAFDWYHVNSIMKDDHGNYLISARYTHSIAYIDGKTGTILWVLGGKRNQFMDLSGGQGLNFAWQHDARFHALDAFPEIYTAPPSEQGVERRLLTLFDNAAEDKHYDYGVEEARGLLLEVTFPSLPGAVPASKPWPVKHGLTGKALNDEKVAVINGTDSRYTVRVIHSYENPHKMRSSSQGSLQILEGDRSKILIGFGLNAVWTEYDVNGTVLCDVHYGSETSWEHGHVQSYRTYKFPWVGMPTTNPKLNVSDDGLELFTSWNGATEVTDWLLQGSKTSPSDGEHWADLLEVTRQGFETAMDIPSRASSMRFLRILALDQSGQVLDHGVSAALDMQPYDADIDPIEHPQQIYSQDPLSVFLVIIFAILSLAGTYELLKRWRSRKSGRSAAGRWQLRNGSWYRSILHSDV